MNACSSAAETGLSRPRPCSGLSRLGNEAKGAPFRNEEVPEGKAPPEIPTQARIVSHDLRDRDQPHGLVEACLAHHFCHQTHSLYIVLRSQTPA